jgi:hypothetical protein
MPTTPSKAADNSAESTSANSTPETAAPPQQEFGEILKKILTTMEGMEKRQEVMQQGLEEMNQGLERLNKITGILVEEKARARASRMFGSDIFHQVDS